MVQRRTKATGHLVLLVHVVTCGRPRHVMWSSTFRTFGRTPFTLIPGRYLEGRWKHLPGDFVVVHIGHVMWSSTLRTFVKAGKRVLTQAPFHLWILGRHLAGEVTTSGRSPGCGHLWLSQARDVAVFRPYLKFPYLLTCASLPSWWSVVFSSRHIVWSRIKKKVFRVLGWY